MKKILILFIMLILTSCCKPSSSSDINSILLSIKDYTCDMEITFFSNKNSIISNATQKYNYPDNYTINFQDSNNLSIDYSDKMLVISNTFFNSSESYPNYENINTNPLFLSYFLNSYFNSPQQNIISCDSNSVSIILPKNNAFLNKATLNVNNNIPYSLTYYDENNEPKINIIYNKFNFGSS